MVVDAPVASTMNVSALVPSFWIEMPKVIVCPRGADPVRLWPEDVVLYCTDQMTSSGRVTPESYMFTVTRYGRPL